MTKHTFFILHLGLGSFHRAHQALYLQRLQDIGFSGSEASWALAGGNIRPETANGAMSASMKSLIDNHGAYTLETISPQGKHDYKRITALQKIVPYTSDLHELVAIGADAQTRIISFTVTEAGYYLDAKNQLDWNYADLTADSIAAKSGVPHASGSTIYGALTAILRARMCSANDCPITLLNCDNLRHNGDRSRGGLMQFLERLGDQPLLAWVEANTTSPNAMVDRITPRPTPDVSARVLATTGIDDPAAVMGESFIQWVIEDNFAAGRPAWEKVGVELVDSVQAYEEAKIRLLNATHSCIAWAGTLRGYAYIHEGTLDPEIRKMAYEYVTNDTIPVLDTSQKPSPLDLAAYRDTVLDRFANAAILDTNQRVAMDGFSKIPSFIVPTIRERLANGASISSVAILPALFLAYLRLWHTGQIPYNYEDQAMDAAATHAVFQTPDTVAAFAALSTLWGELASDPRLVAALRAANAHLQQLGFI